MDNRHQGTVWKSEHYSLPEKSRAGRHDKSSDDKAPSAWQAAQTVAAFSFVITACFYVWGYSGLDAYYSAFGVPAPMWRTAWGTPEILLEGGDYGLRLVPFLCVA